MRSPRIRVLAIACVVWLLDFSSKRWALSALADGQQIDLIGSFLRLRLTRNSGAAFSLGTGVTWLFTLIAIAVIIAILIAAARVRHWTWMVGFGGLAGGALGNLTDRLTQPPAFGLGHVVDFIAAPNFPVFNLADSAIVGSVALMVLASWRGIPALEEEHA